MSASPSSLKAATHTARCFPSIRQTALTVLVCAALGSCGGSGGGGGNSGGGTPTPPPGQPDVNIKFELPPAITPVIEGQAAGVAAAGQPAAVLQSQASSPVAYDQRTPQRVWVVNPDQDSVSVIDSAGLAVLKEIPVGRAPRTLAIDNAGYVWVSNRAGGSISIIHPDSLEVVTTINLSPSAQPYGVVNAPDGSGVWVSLIGGQEIMQFDPVSRQLKRRIGVGPEVRHLAITPDSRMLLASRFISPPLPDENTFTPRIKGEGVRGGEVMVVRLDQPQPKLQSIIPLAVSEVPDSAITGRGLPNYVGAAAISPDGKTAWIPSKQDNIQRGMKRDGLPLEFQNTIRAIVSKVNLDGQTPTENLDARFDLDNTSLASAVAYTPDGRYLLVALETSREMAIMDARTGREIRRFIMAGGFAPQGVAISADGRQAAVANFMSRDVSFFDLSALTEDPLSVNALPGHVRVETLSTPEKLPAQIFRGKQLFYDAFDPRLATDRYMSCAACHNDGYGDGRVWDMSGFGEGLRKTISLRGHGGKKERLHWSGNFDEVQDFEQQIRALSGGEGLLTDAQFRGRRNNPLGYPKAGASEDLDALAAYVDGLTTYAPSPWRTPDRRLSTAARAGEALFDSKTCATCHSSPDLGGDGTKLDDIGTLKAEPGVSGQVQGEPLTGIATPGLRDAWYSAPYFHDGSALTLPDAIKAHKDIALSDEEVAQLSAYIREVGNGE